MHARLNLIALLATSLLFLGACGDSGANSSPLANGGISGTGEGTVTGYGSIIINDTRQFGIAANTSLSLDDEPVTEAELLARGNGFVARVDVGDDVSADFTSGTAVNVILEHLVKGPVTSVAPLEVLGQPVFTTGDTVLASIPGPGLSLNDLVEVSGSAGAGNVIQATRLEFKAGGIPVWKLIGTVTDLGTGTLSIGTQVVAIAGVTPRDCGGGPVIGDLVEIKAISDPGFAPGGDILDTVTDLECRAPGLQVPPGMTTGTLRAEIEGIVDAILVAGPPPSSFTVRGQEVHTTGSTVYEGGDELDIDIGVKLEAEGTLDVATGILTAEKIRFRQARVRMEGPAGAVVTGESVVVMGLTVWGTPLTEDVDGILAGLGNLQVRMRGFVDGSGQIFADRLEERDPVPSNLDVRLRGPVSSIAGDPLFSILGVTIDTTGTTTFRDQAGIVIPRAQFFSTIAVGTPVDAESGTYNGTNIITGPNPVSIED